MQAVRACPVCRQVTHYVTPSLVWPADEDEKEAIRDAYKNKLASIDCRRAVPLPSEALATSALTMRSDSVLQASSKIIPSCSACLTSEGYPQCWPVLRRFFDYGRGTCPFSTSCMYRHAYRNGQLEVSERLACKYLRVFFQHM